MVALAGNFNLVNGKKFMPLYHFQFDLSMRQAGVVGSDGRATRGIRDGLVNSSLLNGKLLLAADGCRCDLEELGERQVLRGHL